MKLPAFLKTVLWDVDIRTIDPKRHKQFLITRIAEKGQWKDILWLRKQYGNRAIQTTVARSKNTSKKTKNFWKFL